MGKSCRKPLPDGTTKIMHSLVDGIRATRSPDRPQRRIQSQRVSSLQNPTWLRQTAGGTHPLGCAEIVPNEVGNMAPARDLQDRAAKEGQCRGNCADSAPRRA